MGIFELCHGEPGIFTVKVMLWCQEESVGVFEAVEGGEHYSQGMQPRKQNDV